jgi:hypothetical protein
MISGNIYSLEEYLRNNPDIFDLFIGSISFEKRCLGAAKLMGNASQSLQRLYFIDYLYLLNILSERQAVMIKKDRKKRIKQQADNKAILVGMYPDAEFPSVRISSPLTDISNYVESFFNKEQIHINRAERICIDITTFTKPFFFLILKMVVENFKKKKLFIINTIPSRYTPDPLSFNVWGAEIMPAYNGIWNPQNRNALIAVLGFEGNKLASILSKWSFTEISPIIGFPAFYPGLQDRALSAHISTLKNLDALSHIKYAPALNPFESYIVMKNILGTYPSGYNVALAPLGPKPMALASALLAIENQLRVVYTFPQDYSSAYSHEIGKSYLYEVNLS